MMLPDFGERALRIQDELASDALRSFELVRINILEQHIVDKANERRNARDLLLTAWLKKNAHASFVHRTWAFYQKAGFFETPHFGRHVRRGERNVIGKTADGDPAGALCVCHSHQHDELAGG
jgi:hypothetical protein